MDVLLRSANDASALVFLVVESDDTYDACRAVLGALGKAQGIASGIDPSSSEDPWLELKEDMGRAMRDFQIAARKELGLTGVIRPWPAPDDTSGAQSPT
jgi:hypothetical protein